MAQILVRNLDDSVVADLKRVAQLHGRSLEAEVREVLTAATRSDRSELRARLAAMRARQGPQTGPDSVELIREDRDR